MNSAVQPVVLEAKNIYRSFTDGKSHVDVIKDLSLQVYQGEFVSIVGSSGSGNFMTRMTALLATLFFIISLVLGNINSNKTNKGSEWENLSAPVKTEQTQPAAPAKPTSDIPN